MGVVSIGVMKPQFVMKAIVPVIFAAAIAVYGVIVSIMILNQCTPLFVAKIITHNIVIVDVNKDYTGVKGYLHFGGGLATGLCGMASGISIIPFFNHDVNSMTGMAIGIAGDAGARGAGQQPKIYVSVVLILIFAEALSLFGLVVGIMTVNKNGGTCA